MPSTTPETRLGRHAQLRGWLSLFIAVAARTYLVLLLALAACALVPMLGGMTATVVHGTSMEPHVVSGDVALSTAFDQADAIPLGLVVSFAAPAGSGRSGLILHRIVAVDQDGGLVTAGDGNADVDDWRLEKSDIISVAHLLVPSVGLPAVWLDEGDARSFAAWIAITLAAIAIEILAVRSERPRRRDRSNSGRIAVLSLATVVLPLGILGGVGGVDAAFTGQATSVGNTWTAASSSPANKLVFTTNPSGATGGTAFGVQPVVTVHNAAGETKSGTRTITLAITTAGGASLKCASNPVVTTTGIAAFAGCALDKVGTYTLTATSGSLAPAVSTAIRITAGVPARLVFAASPSNASVSAPFTTQPAVSVVDAGGNIAAGNVPVSLKLTTSAGAKLACSTNPVTSVGGASKFAGCRVDKAGSYTLTASSGKLAIGTSASFVVSAAKPLTCNSTIWMATYSWTPTPQVATKYTLYVNGLAVPATGADGWNSYVQLTSNNVPASSFAAGTATVEVRKVLSDGTEQTIGTGTVVLGAAGYRTYTCG